jgi:ribonuclease P protein component
MTAHNNTYPRTEKLKSRKLIQQLFAEGKSVTASPVKCIYLVNPPELSETLQTGVGASARNFKKAVHRNRIKRLLREAYRLNNQFLHQQLEEKKIRVALFVLFIGKELPTLPIIETAVKAALEKLRKTFE